MFDTKKLAAVIFLFGFSLSWNLQAHSVIANIAEKILKQKDDQILQKVYKKVEQLHEQFKSVEMKGSLLEVAVSPDMLNFEFGKFLEKYHYKDIPFLYKNDKNSFKLPRIEEINASQALRDSRRVIIESKKPKPGRFLNYGLVDSLLTRYVIHVTGDVHQPLHTVSLYSDVLLEGNIKNGDKGGNLFKVAYPGNQNLTNFHSLWDDGCGIFRRMEKFPYGEADKAEILKLADDLMTEYPLSYFGKLAEELDFDKWIQESNELAIDFAYSEVGIFPTIRPEYIIQCRDISKERVTLAGYRLANFLKDIFSDN